MAAIAIVVLILLVGLTMQSNNLKARIAVYDAKAAALKQSIEDEQDRTKEIDEQKEYMQTDEYIAEVARSFLKKRSNIRNKADFAEKFFLTAAFV